MDEEEPQHWPTERMIQEGHAEYALPGDLTDLPDDILQGIAAICEVSTYAPGECIPCLAAVILAERIQAEKEGSPGPGEETIPFEEPRIPSELLEETQVTVHGRIVTAARDLMGLLQQLPPVDVNEDELALLVVAAQRWIAVTEAQGNELSPPAQQILDATKNVVARLHHG